MTPSMEIVYFGNEDLIRTSDAPTMSNGGTGEGIEDIFG